ncbi:MAG: hypothetical protein P8X57_02925 [Cyclobacteriaceae bacterium]
MRHFFTSILIAAGIIHPLFSQINMPVNQSMAGETERIFIQRASNGTVVDPFYMHALANYEIDTVKISEFREELSAFIEKLSVRYDKEVHTRQLLNSLFYKVHQKYLRNYSAYSTFGQLIDEGSYDCLTGTILYASLVEELGFENHVIVTRHHTYLMIDTNEGSFMYESTDALNGFIYRTDEIAARLAEISMEESSDQVLAHGNVTVDFNDLIGLQYYNAAINAYNKMDFKQAVDQLEKGAVFYRGEIVTQFGALLARAIVASDLDREEKTAYLMKLTHSLNGGSVMASIN